MIQNELFEQACGMVKAGIIFDHLKQNNTIIFKKTPSVSVKMQITMTDGAGISSFMVAEFYPFSEGAKEGTYKRMNSFDETTMKKFIVENLKSIPLFSSQGLEQGLENEN
jgi:hypothetical protein